MLSEHKQTELYGQNSKFAIIELLIPFIKNKNFLDINAAQGAFARFLTRHYFTGTLFESLPQYAYKLKNLTQSTQCQFFSYIIDKNDTRINDQNSIIADCRSLNSLCKENLITHDIGILKIETESNTLNVLQGASELHIETIICEFFTSDFHSDWAQNNLDDLIEEAKKFGLNHYFAIQRLEDHELISIDHVNTFNLQLGTLIFVNQPTYEKIATTIQQISKNKENILAILFKSRLDEFEKENAILRKVCNERLGLIKKLHLEIKNNRFLDTNRLIKASTAFLTEFNIFYDQIHERLHSLQHLENIAKKELTLKDHLNSTLKIFQDTLSSLHEKYANINKEKYRLMEHQQHSVAFHRDGTLLGQARFFLGRIKTAVTPKLGNLIHYPPRVLEIPKNYLKKTKRTKFPLISIVTPTFQQGTFLERTIKSIIEQNYENLEYVIQDGGCDQSTNQILKKYESSLKHWESIPDSGQSHALNLGFRHTTGEIMAYLNSDDLLLPGSLHYIGEFFATHPKVDVIYGHRVLINENDEEIGRWILPPHDSKVISWADYIPQETLFWRRRVWNMIGAKIDESFRFAMDWDLILRFREVGAHFVRLPRFIGAFRIHPHQKTSAHLSNTGMDEMNRLRERCHGRQTPMHEIKPHIRSYLYKHLICHRLYRLGILQY